MDKKRSRITYLLVAASLCLAAWAASAMPKLQKPNTLPTTDVPHVDPKPPLTVQIPQAPPRVEVVFALDTTGSMSGLIEGAKRKIWSISQYIAQGQPRPDLRIGLVAYRDKGDAYVTRFYDLTDDLDEVFNKLQSFEAGGGGDTPEHVSKALYDAVYRTSWSQGQNALKQIYLVGDAPPHTDYNDGYDYRKIAKHANELGIHINTIRCGYDRDTERAWNEISNSAAGVYASIDQSGGMVATATPYDDKLAELNSRLVGTAMGYGRGAGAVAAKIEASHHLSKEAAADRAGVLGLMGGAAVTGEGDLGRDYKAGKVDVTTAPAAALPEPMRAMDPAARKKYVEQKNAEREKISEEINSIAKQRNDYLKSHSKKDSFDGRVDEAVKSQAASIGLKY
jgi:Mg-chelatase subunit ChlD